MRGKLLAIVAGVIIASPCYADRWAEQDTYRELAYLTVHCMDWSQTRYISDHPSQYHELNPILGKHPSGGEVNRYFIVTGMAHALISVALPQPYRKYWQYTTATFEAGVVGYNASIGIGFSF